MAKSKGQLVDEFMALQASKALLAKREKALKSALFAVAKRDADGLLFVESQSARVTISEVPAAMIFDPKAAKEILSDAMYKLCMKPKSPGLRYNGKAKVADAKKGVAA